MKIAFTSCSNIKMQQDNQPIWGIIHAQKPDLLLLLGDNVYIGTDGVFDAAMLEQKYKRQLAEPHFNKLLCEVPYLAIWDNHDMGIASNVYRVLTPEELEQSRDLFYRYLKYRSVIPYSVISGTKEIYCSHTVGNVKFIMLDVRSHQEDPDGNDDASLLGAAQEQWLFQEMNSSTGITIICSGISYSFNEKGWSRYKNWFKEFNHKVAETSKPLFLAGDIHRNYFKHHLVRREPVLGFPETSFLGSPHQPPTFFDKNFYEILSSSVGRNVDGHSSNTPLNNYGIIDINSSTVEITLYSQQAHNFIHQVINRETWAVIN